MQKEALRRLPYDVVQDARKTYRINGNPTHPHIKVVEERSVLSDRANCGACEKKFTKGDKALYIEHHVDKDNNPYHINRKYVCFDDCKHLDEPEPSQAPISSDKPTKSQKEHPCPWVIHGCQFRGNSDQIKKHLNPNLQQKAIEAGDPEEVAECYFNRFRESSIKSAHCGECGETLEFDADEVANHIEGDGEEFTELKKRIEELEADDEKAVKALRNDEMDAADLHEHIQRDEEAFDDLIEKIQDMKEEDGNLSEEIGGNRTYIESNENYHSTDDLRQHGIPENDIEFIKNLDGHLGNSDISKTAAHEFKYTPQYDENQRANVDKNNKWHPIRKRKQKELNERFYSTDELNKDIFQEGDEEFVRNLSTMGQGVSSKSVGTSRGLKSKRFMVRNKETCTTCGNATSGTHADRIFGGAPYQTTLKEALEVIHSKDPGIIDDHRREAIAALKDPSFMAANYVDSNVDRTCSGCNQERNGHNHSLSPDQGIRAIREHHIRDTQESHGPSAAQLQSQVHEAIDRQMVPAKRTASLYEQFHPESEVYGSREVPLTGQQDTIARSQHRQQLSEIHNNFTSGPRRIISGLLEKATSAKRFTAEPNEGFDEEHSRAIINELSKQKETSYKFGNFKNYSSDDAADGGLTGEELDARREKLKNAGYEMCGMCGAAKDPETGQYLEKHEGICSFMNTSSIKSSSFKRVKISQDGGGGGGASGGDGGGAASGGDSGGSEGGGEGGDSGLSVGPSGEGKTTDTNFTIGADECPRCRGNSFIPVNNGPFYSCSNCGYTYHKKKKRHSNWIDQVSPAVQEDAAEQLPIEIDTTPIIPNMYITGDSMNPAPGTADNGIYNPIPNTQRMLQSPLTMVNASVHEAAPTIVPYKKVWKRIHKINIPQNGICPRCHKHINYLGLCNTCRLNTGMQWHRMNSEALEEGT